MSLFRKNKRVSNDDYFISLIRVAGEDEELGKQLKAILQLDSFNRQSMLNTWLDQLRMHQAPEHLISALSRLLDDEVAEKALELITDKAGR